MGFQGLVGAAKGCFGCSDGKLDGGRGRMEAQEGVIVNILQCSSLDN